jgi:2'-5' RNA ligase
VRLFIGIPVKFEEWLQRVYSRVEALRADIKMVEPKNVHITLAFLGEVREEKVDLVKESMKEVKFSTFSLTFKGLGAFPSLSRPRVIWVGISNGFNDLKTLRTSLVKSLAARGVRPDSQGSHLRGARLYPGSLRCLGRGGEDSRSTRDSFIQG